jgi:hypothetical protein
MLTRTLCTCFIWLTLFCPSWHISCLMSTTYHLCQRKDYTQPPTTIRRRCPAAAPPPFSLSGRNPPLLLRRLSLVSPRRSPSLRRRRCFLPLPTPAPLPLLTCTAALSIRAGSPTPTTTTISSSSTSCLRCHGYRVPDPCLAIDDDAKSTATPCDRA